MSETVSIPAGERRTAAAKGDDKAEERSSKGEGIGCVSRRSTVRIETKRRMFFAG